MAGAGHKKQPFEKVQFPPCSHSDTWRAGEPKAMAEWALTLTMGSSESQPLPPGTALGTQPNRALTANMADKCEKLFSKMLLTWVQY